MKKINFSILLSLSSILIFISCRNETHFTKKIYYKSGELLSEIPYRTSDSLKDGTYKEYYKNGNIKQIIYLKNNLPVDSAMMYYETGELKFKEIRKIDSIFGNHYYKTGSVSIKSNFLNTNPPIEIGWTSIYRENGQIKDSLEYLNVNGNAHLNQRLNFDNENHIVNDSSHYFNFKISKIDNQNNYQFKINYLPLIKNADVLLIVGDSINNDFSNLKRIHLDSLYMENNEIVTNKLDKEFRCLKGLFYEYKAQVVDSTNLDSVRMTINENKTYFNVRVAVSDTIELEK
ncbi:toxin-antitoxin system YwqK family antitoxin [Maribacter aquivivus]|uniref:toxin-antitoxin system YwqK family antitoxin n=1 Tax=Maribacter aquivivus TaxID=228958 RepID=UPI002490D487|nr:hypothetical protein [Maribacter aquivivus]